MNSQGNVILVVNGKKVRGHVVKLFNKTYRPIAPEIKAELVI